MTPEERVAARTRAVEENNASLWFHNDELEKANAELRAQSEAAQAAQEEAGA